MSEDEELRAEIERLNKIIRAGEWATHAERFAILKGLEHGRCPSCGGRIRLKAGRGEGGISLEACEAHERDPMRVIACLSWFEESPTWLASLVTSLAGFCDHVVAVDGAFFLYPEAMKHPVSGPEQAEAVIQTAKAAGMGVTVHVPSHPWMGNETEKRTFLFRAGLMVAEPLRDWLFIVDGDDIVDRVPYDAHLRLEQTDKDVAEVSLWSREDWEQTDTKTDLANRMNGEAPDEWTISHRALFRALPTLRCGFAHMVYEAERDGETVYLRGDPATVGTLEEAEDLLDLRVEHRHAFRNLSRKHASAEYQHARDELRIEAAPSIA